MLQTVIEFDSFIWLFCQHFLYQVFRCSRDTVPSSTHEDHILLHYLSFNIRLLEREPTTEQIIHCYATSPDIQRFFIRIWRATCTENFWWHVLRCACYHPFWFLKRRFFIRALVNLRKAEVYYAKLVLFVQQAILWFDVAMDDTIPMYMQYTF